MAAIIFKNPQQRRVRIEVMGGSVGRQAQEIPAGSNSLTVLVPPGTYSVIYEFLDNHDAYGRDGLRVTEAASLVITMHSNASSPEHSAGGRASAGTGCLLPATLVLFLGSLGLALVASLH